MAINPIHLIRLESSLIAQEPFHRTEEPASVVEEPLRPDPPYVPDLARISKNLRQASHARQRAIRLEHHLLQSCVANARAVRLGHAAYSVRRTLAECLKAEDKQSFLTLINVYHDLSEQCLDACTSFGRPRLGRSFLDQLPVSSQEAVLTLLHRVRCDGDFIAERLALLSQRELQSLYPERITFRHGESVINAGPWSPSRASPHLGYAVDAQTENLSSCEYASPLRTLMGVACGTDHDLGLRVWSSVCARLVQDKRQGSEKIVPAILDVWASQSAWSGKDRFEQWLSRTVQDGAFLGDLPSKSSFRVRVRGWHESSPEDSTRAESFYEAAVGSLLDILGDTSGASVIPESILDMCRTVWSLLDSSPAHQRMFPQFIATRWLFSSFLSDAIISPEAYGMLDNQFVSDNIRQYVLREIASRTQKAVLDVIYSWRHGNAVAALAPERVQRVLERFQVAQAVRMAVPANEGLLCTVSARELVSVINTLYPKQRPASILSRSDAAQSSASSVSGFSLFSNVGSDFPRTSPISALQDSSSAATVDSHSTTSVNADRPQLLDLDKLSIWSDHEQLQEACSLLEDFCMTHNEVGSAMFATMVTHSEGKRLCSVDERLQTGSLSTVDRRELRKAMGAVESALMRCSESVLSTNAGFENVLVSIFEDFISNAERMAAFLEAHEWSTRLDHMLSLTAEYPLAYLLRRIDDNTVQTLQTTVKAADMYERLLEGVRPRLDLSMANLANNVTKCKDLRIKMWYITDVRTSAPYDEARTVTTALRTMAKPKQPVKAKTSPPALRHWGTTKLANSNLHFKTEAQVLDLIGASREQGGPNKLTDDQSRIVSLWLDNNGIENLCRGEERIHKFCMEVRKCSNQLTGDNAAVWSSPFFADHWSPRGKGEELNVPLRLDKPSFSITPKSSAGFSSHHEHALLNARSNDDIGPCSPALTSKSSAPFWSPAVTDADITSSATSVGSARLQAHLNHYPSSAPAQTNARARLLEQRLTSMLVSDLGMSLFNDGTETDANLFSGFGGELTTLHLNKQRAKQQSPTRKSRFDYQSTFKILLKRFESLVDPCVKLAVLDELNRLITALVLQNHCGLEPNPRAEPTSNANADQFLALFSDASARPSAIFRDMQYIASLVPEALSANTPQGEAFSNAAFAVLRLKGDLMSHFVSIADGIIQYHTNNRAHGRASSYAQEQRDSATFLPHPRTPPAQDVAKYGMPHAAFLLQVTAKEGIAPAQRELGTLYLTHPELVDHAIAPLTRPREVFKEELESVWRKNQDPARCDPATMCVAHHWMSLASQGGDALAQEYLRQREEMERLP